MAGWLGAAVDLYDAMDCSVVSCYSDWVGVLKLALGVYLVVAAVRKFRGRPRAGEEGGMPAWMDGIVGFGPGRSVGAGLALGAVNPKNLVVAPAAAATIASAALPGVQEIGAIAVYVFVAVLGVAAPIVVTLFLGDRSHEVLTGGGGPGSVRTTQRSCRCCS